MRISVFVGIMWIACSAAFAQTAVPPAHGDGLTAATAYQLTQLGNLVWLGDEAKASRTAGKYYRLMDDIDASETARWNDPGTTTDILEGFIPITPFDGIFEGSGHTIKNITVNRSSAINGLFENIGSNARVSNLNLPGCSINGDTVGCLAGKNSGAITNCHASGVVQGKISGGLIGSNLNGIIRDCTTDCATTVSSARYVGGLIGSSSGGTMANCSSSGNLFANASTGGVIGYSNADQVTQCHATGAINGYIAGGLIGQMTDSIISKSFSTGDVYGYERAGGLIGESNCGSISLCYAASNVKGWIFSGGLVGTIFGGSTVDNCYSSGSVDFAYGCTGGLTGEIYGGNTKYFYAAVYFKKSAGSNGLIGVIYDSNTMISSYFDYEIGHIPNAGGVTSKTTEQMRTQSTFANWDFDKVWGIQNGYPFLRQLPTVTVIYVAGKGGLVSEGSLRKTYLFQTLNLGTATMAVTAVPDPGFEFAGWSDGKTDAVRTDKKVMAAMNVTANFKSTRNAASGWVLYR